MESSLLAKHLDHIAGKRNNSMAHHNLVHKFIPMPQAMKNAGCKSCSGQGLEKARYNPSMEIGERQEQGGGHSRSTKRQKESPLCNIDGHKTRSWNLNYKKYKGRVVLLGDIVKDNSVWSLHSFYCTGLVSVPNDCRKSDGYHCKTAGL